MLAKFTKHALVRRVDAASTGARASSIDHACNDNARAGAGAAAGRTRTRRQVLACHWRVVPATGALECFWQDESADGAAAPSPWRSRMRHAGSGSVYTSVIASQNRASQLSLDRDLRLGDVPGAVEEAVASDVARLLVVFPIVEGTAFVGPLLAAVVAGDDGVVAHRHRTG
jgi:hypothetical protein